MISSSPKKRRQKRFLNLAVATGSWRFYGILILFAILASFILARLVQLHISDTDFLQAQGDARTLRVVDIPTFRGMITDRRHTPLAISTPVHAAWINPRHFQPTHAQRNALAKLLSISSNTLKQKENLPSQRAFVYLKRGLSPLLAEKIKALNIPGLFLQREFKRFYPSGAQTAQLVGFTNIDDDGQAGVELCFNHALKPIIGKKRVLEDRAGRWVKDIAYLQMPQSGQDIQLSIDIRLQGFAYRELIKALNETKAKSATLVMLDIQTGEVLAMVSAPSFNPNNRQECQGNATRNRSVTDIIEPGSTIKAFSIASALASKRFTAKSTINTSPGVFRVAGHTIKDFRDYGTLSLPDILIKSSNVGISKLTLELPPEQLLDTFRKLGIGDSIQTPFPGERRGILPKPPSNPFVHATLAFGYGLSATPLQIAHAFATLGSEGNMLPISLLKVTSPHLVQSKRVLPKEVADTTLSMLADVIAKGTGSRAAIPGYKTAGKTGTTRVVGPNGYDRNRHIALFAGITPVDKPRLATLVVVEEPDESKYYGGLVAAPIYKNVVSKALHLLNIPPDNTA